MSLICSVCLCVHAHYPSPPQMQAGLRLRHRLIGEAWLGWNPACNHIKAFWLSPPFPHRRKIGTESLLSQYNAPLTLLGWGDCTCTCMCVVYVHSTCIWLWHLSRLIFSKLSYSVVCICTVSCTCMYVWELAPGPAWCIVHACMCICTLLVIFSLLSIGPKSILKTSPECLQELVHTPLKHPHLEHNIMHVLAQTLLGMSHSFIMCSWCVQ